MKYNKNLKAKPTLLVVLLALVTNESIQSLINYIKEQDKLNRHLLEKIEEMEKERKSDREILERMEHQLTRQENRANERDKILMENIRSIQQLAITKKKNLCGIVYLINNKRLTLCYIRSESFCLLPISRVM